MNELKIDNFIMVQDNFATSEYCDELINYFHKMNHAGFGFNRKGYKSAHSISDTAVAMHDNATIKFSGTCQLNDIFVDMFWKDAYPKYTERYSIIEKFPYHSIFYTKLQKSVVGDGYHEWHCENSSRTECSRILTYILYLNDVIEGGETEFLYYPIRVKPRKGKFVLFPAAFTHTHRGNPPLTNEKYILTGWVEI